ncbi:MAG: hypothetical protein OEM97_10860, partial [Acidimicrobiia bacterium]|nr:hypothetical protein [Acidimicrobiia bacterium]
MTTATTGTADVHDFDDFDPLARWIIVVATAEARLARHPVVSSAHLILASWLAVSTPTGHALREAGLSGRIAKAWLDHEIRPETRVDEPVHDADLLTKIRDVARNHGSDRISVE